MLFGTRTSAYRPSKVAAIPAAPRIGKMLGTARVSGGVTVLVVALVVVMATVLVVAMAVGVATVLVAVLVVVGIDDRADEMEEVGTPSLEGGPNLRRSRHSAIARSQDLSTTSLVGSSKISGASMSA